MAEKGWEGMNSQTTLPSTTANGLQVVAAARDIACSTLAELPVAALLWEALLNVPQSASVVSPSVKTDHVAVRLRGFGHGEHLRRSEPCQRRAAPCHHRDNPREDPPRPRQWPEEELSHNIAAAGPKIENNPTLWFVLPEFDSIDNTQVLRELSRVAKVCQQPAGPKPDSCVVIDPLSHAFFFTSPFVKQAFVFLSCFICQLFP